MSITQFLPVAEAAPRIPVTKEPCLSVNGCKRVSINSIQLSNIVLAMECFHCIHNVVFCDNNCRLHVGQVVIRDKLFISYPCLSAKALYWLYVYRESYCSIHQGAIRTAHFRLLSLQ